MSHLGPRARTRVGQSEEIAHNLHGVDDFPRARTAPRSTTSKDPRAQPDDTMTALPDQGAASWYRRPDRADVVAVKPFLASVEKRLEEFIDERCEILVDVGPDLEPVARALREMARGGKRLRATFCYWGWRGAGGVVPDAAVDGAAALELFHLGALVHDDLMDHSDTRRGSSTAHEHFAGRHRDERLDGDAAEFGRGAALLMGDLCLAWSDELLAGAALDPSARRAVRTIYDLMRTQVMAGQYLDMLEQARPGTRRDASGVVLRFKSAKYTVEHPLMVGGALAGASGEVLDTYSRYGIPVGEAFQLRDDVLGVFGDPVRTGKPVGDDLREGKKTLLVLAALDRADETQDGLLRDGLGDGELTAQRVRELQQVLVDTGALDDVERQIVDLTDQGVAAIRDGAVPDHVAAELADLALHIAGRTS
jgi:geranylgeranyl diphosphate synthase type I